MAKTFELKIENKSGYFVATADEGWVRVGLIDCECFDFPPEHSANAEVVALDIDGIDGFYDEAFSKYAAMCKTSGLAI